MAEKEYVERNSVLAWLNWFEDFSCPATHEALRAVDKIRSKLIKTPAADVAPVVHGEWRWEGKFKACSKCGTHVEWAETLGSSFWNYCPYCGAKMDGGKHRERSKPENNRTN